ncbi:hypothetical protein C8R45DRAFT_1102599 [Mycena sanguinolenta]|nr:hypothetical protein C8R45DRAFT_1102599 [Mycena sanguinolenta]
MESRSKRLVDVKRPPIPYVSVKSLPITPISMTRYEIQLGDITVAYGSDDVLGVFLSVEDARLMWKENASQEINQIASDAATGSYRDGGGVYLALTTGMGIGKKVSKAAMVEFMKRYGVPAKHLDAVVRGQEF